MAVSTGSGKTIRSDPYLFAKVSTVLGGERSRIEMPKLRTPYFVRAALLKDGRVELVDDDGETYHVEMRREMEWPLISRMVRNRDMRQIGEAVRTRPEPPPPSGPFKPRVVR
jgi:hypothetical protein